MTINLAKFPKVHKFLNLANLAKFAELRRFCGVRKTQKIREIPQTSRIRQISPIRRRRLSRQVPAAAGRAAHDGADPPSRAASQNASQALSLVSLRELARRPPPDARIGAQGKPDCIRPDCINRIAFSLRGQTWSQILADWGLDF